MPSPLLAGLLNCVFSQALAASPIICRPRHTRGLWRFDIKGKLSYEASEGDAGILEDPALWPLFRLAEAIKKGQAVAVENFSGGLRLVPGLGCQRQ
ncbi:hypothetical protein RFM99_15810 [Mesorhizobium sp. VK4C]|uniref:hypothetical protein n=1 Tax=Mesorhizobium captivum TaxID=3072319 RepID=UPI002A23EC76|nr:hypothetical protein [Mesorhizobium sp. VK4C]MDX8499885.1 hypothetical protein [Mesorhizobium sp. VK4C]